MDPGDHGPSVMMLASGIAGVDSDEMVLVEPGMKWPTPRGRMLGIWTGEQGWSIAHVGLSETEAYRRKAEWRR